MRWHAIAIFMRSRAYFIIIPVFELQHTIQIFHQAKRSGLASLMARNYLQSRFTV